MVLNSRMASRRMVEFGSTQEAVNWKVPSRPSQERVQVNRRGTGFVTAREMNNRPGHGAMNAVSLIPQINLCPAAALKNWVWNLSSQ